MRVTLPMTADGRVLLDVRGDVSAVLLARLAALGAEVTGSSARDRHVAVRAPLSIVSAIAELPGVSGVMPELGWMTSRSVAPGLRVIDRPARSQTAGRRTEDRPRLLASLQSALRARQQGPGGIPSTGGITSEGDITHAAWEARRDFGVTGAGIKIGVLSDGVNGLASSQANGNVGPVTVLAAGERKRGHRDARDHRGSRARRSVVFRHGARRPGRASRSASAICGRPAATSSSTTSSTSSRRAFQDGQSLPRKPTAASSSRPSRRSPRRAPCTSPSAGNSGALDADTSGTWEGDFVDGGLATDVLDGAGQLHSFGPSTYNTLVSSGHTFNTLSWADPLGASGNDYDLFLLDSTGTTVISASTNVQDGSQDPWEVVSAGEDSHRLVIARFSGERALPASVDESRPPGDRDERPGPRACRDERDELVCGGRDTRVCRFRLHRALRRLVHQRQSSGAVQLGWPAADLLHVCRRCDHARKFFRNRRPGSRQARHHRGGRRVDQRARILAVLRDVGGGPACRRHCGTDALPESQAIGCPDGRRAEVTRRSTSRAGLGSRFRLRDRHGAPGRCRGRSGFGPRAAHRPDLETHRSAARRWRHGTPSRAPRSYTLRFSLTAGRRRRPPPAIFRGHPPRCQA